MHKHTEMYVKITGHQTVYFQTERLGQPAPFESGVPWICTHK